MHAFRFGYNLSTLYPAPSKGSQSIKIFPCLASRRQVLSPFQVQNRHLGRVHAGTLINTNQNLDHAHMSTMATSTSPDATVILGGGIIGLSTAYYLSLHQPDLAKNSPIHIVDSAPSLLLSASGFAGGFLAKDWFSSASSSLGALSFRLHRELAEAHDGARRWGYAKSTAYSLSIDEHGVGGKSRKRLQGDDWLESGTSRANGVLSTPNGDGAKRDEMLNEDGTPAWITEQEGGTLERISGEESCAQVEPKELCEFLLEEIEKRGVKIHLSSKVTGLANDDTSQTSGVTMNNNDGETTIQCKNIVITSGAWSTQVFKTLFPQSKTRLGIGPLAGYSITVRSPRYSKPIVDPMKHSTTPDAGMCHSVFSAPGPDWSYAPEAISRMTKSGRPEIYIAGLNDSNMPLPPDVTGVKEMYDEAKAADLKRTATFMTGLSREGDDLIEDDLEIVRQGLCLRPLSSTGRPVVAKLDKTQLGTNVEMADGGGVYIAAGHGPWGIALSLGTGLVMSELLQGRKTSADIRSLGVK